MHASPEGDASKNYVMFLVFEFWGFYTHALTSNFFMLTLQPTEQTWLKDYCGALRKHHADKVLRVSVFGSKARGDGGADSDLDVLVILRDGDWRLQAKIRRLGYQHDLAAHGEVLPAIMTYTRRVWDERKSHGNPFQLAVDKEAVSVYG